MLAALVAGCHTGPVRTLENSPAQIVSATFSMDGSLIAAGARDGSVGVWETSSGTEVFRATGFSAKPSFGRINAVALSPDAKRLAFAASENQIQVWDLNSRRLIQTLRGHRFSPRYLGFTSDASKLLACSGGLEVELDYQGRTRQPIRLVLYDLTTGQPIWFEDNDEAEICNVAFSPDGSLIAENSVKHIGRFARPRPAPEPQPFPFLELRDGATGKGETLNKLIRPAWQMVFSPDSKYILCSDGGQGKKGELWQTNPPRRIAMVEAPDGAFSPDSRRLLGVRTGTDARTFIEVTSYDIETGATGRSDRVAVAAQAGDLQLMAISPDLSMFLDSRGRLWKMPKILSQTPAGR